MYCKNCGSLLDDDAAFCEKCGTAVIKKSVCNNEGEPSTVSAPAVLAEDKTENIDVKENALDTTSKPYADENVTEENEGKSQIKPKLKYGIFAGAAIVVIVIIALIVSIVSKGSNQVSFDARAQSNFNAGGEFAYDSEKLYVFGKMNDSDKEESLYSMSYSGINKTKISDNSDINDIRMADGRILYSTYKDSKYSLAIMDVDGGNNTVIKNSIDSLDAYNLESDMIYYTSNDKLYSCKLNGDDEQELRDGVKGFILVGKTIYYSTDNSIYKYDIKKKDSIEICSETGTQLNYDSNRVYFKNDDGIYYIETSGDNPAQRIISDSRVTKYLINGESIYYIQSLSEEERSAVLSQFENEEEYVYTLALIGIFGVGRVKQVSKDGGVVSDVDTNQDIFFSLYAYPNGYYSKSTIFDDNVKAVKVN